MKGESLYGKTEYVFVLVAIVVALETSINLGDFIYLGHGRPHHYHSIVCKYLSLMSEAKSPTMCSSL
jgi:hypothetical protein